MELTEDELKVLKVIVNAFPSRCRLTTIRDRADLGSCCVVFKAMDVLYEKSLIDRDGKATQWGKQLVQEP